MEAKGIPHAQLSITAPGLGTPENHPVNYRGSRKMDQNSSIKFPLAQLWSLRPIPEFQNSCSLNVE
jgi:hypothetical protein